MTGPKRIIDLDGTPQAQWKIDNNSLHLLNKRLWTREVTGCVLCVEADRTDVLGQTLRAQDDEDVAICLTHGPLVSVPYQIVRKSTVVVGDRSREVEQKIEDTLLIPVNLPPDEKESLYDRLLGVAAEEEQSSDILDE